MIPFERELSDAELAHVCGAASSTSQAPLSLSFEDVDHISFSSSENGKLKEEVFFTGGSEILSPTGP